MNTNKTTFDYEGVFSESEHPVSTQYEKIEGDFVTVDHFGTEKILRIRPEALTELTAKAFDDVSHLLRTTHLQKLSGILDDPESSNNDKYVASQLLENAVIAAERIFPSCQDTGTAIIVGKKGQRVWTGVDDNRYILEGVFRTFQEKNLRYSQLAPLSFYNEKNTGTNLPAQIEIYSTNSSEYEFLFIAKGGGSANKSFLYQKTKSLLNPASFEAFIRESVENLGTAACPPYHLAVVVGGLSAEQTLKTVKLASCGYLDGLPTVGSLQGRAFRDPEIEMRVLEWARQSGIGAQFGGKYFVHDVRVIRLPRHGASCPVGIGVSCSADRQIKGKINESGVFLEVLEKNPSQFLSSKTQITDTDTIRLNLNQPIQDILANLSKLPIATRVMLNGPMIVARDIAHARLAEMAQAGKELPEYFRRFPVYYAGPAKTPQGFASGSFGPTTSQRMDPYVPLFQKQGASMIMLGKGNRSSVVTESCHNYGGFYLGSIGGPAAKLGRDCITKVEVIDFEDLGMEAVWKIEVKDFPAFIIIDDKGNDFFNKTNREKFVGIGKRSHSAPQK
jgi:fumarate hydratase class I